MGKLKQRGTENHASSSPPKCAGCQSPLTTINYTAWATMRFDPKQKSYFEDDSPGNADVELSCPNCSAKIDPEGILF
jgi:hypothetical protein